MPVRNAQAQWQGSLKEGKGSLSLGSGAWQGQYSFGSRFEEGAGTNPEELIAAAEAGCFSMALSAGLTNAGYTPTSIQTSADVHINKTPEGGWVIPQIDLRCEAEVPGIDEETFQKVAAETKENCPVSQLLKAAADIRLDAKLSG